MSSTFQQATEVLGLEVTSEQLRVWGTRGGLSIADQALSSGATFMLNLLLARWLTAEEYGAFAVTFATLLFLASYHNVLLIEPVTIMGPAKYTSRMVEYFFAQLKLHFIVVTVLSGLLVIASSGMAALGMRRVLVTGTLGSALAAPFLFLLWLVRRMCYVVQQPSIALSSSVAYFGVLIVGLLVLRVEHSLGPFSAFAGVGVASAAAAVWPLRQIGILRAGARSKRCPIMPVVRESWKYARWLVASTTLSSLASQTQTYAAAALIGLSAAGILRAMQIPALIMTQVITAVALLLLPTMAQDFGNGRNDMLRKKAMASTIGLTAMGASYCIVLWVLAKPIERVLYGGKFSVFAWLIPVLALVPVCTGFSLGFSMALRASQKPHFDLLSNAVSGPVGLITALLFIRAWGLGGAAMSLVCSYAAIAAVLCCSFFWVTKRA